MKKCHVTEMTKQKRYYTTQDRNGTEDEITIRTPDGKSMAFLWFWDEQDEAAKPQADRAKADAWLIVEALNDHQKRLARRKPK